MHRQRSVRSSRPFAGHTGRRAGGPDEAMTKLDDAKPAAEAAAARLVGAVKETCGLDIA
jgi:hypothetical protein